VHDRAQRRVLEPQQRRAWLAGRDDLEPLPLRP
jgi:hypothetical protein